MDDATRRPARQVIHLLPVGRSQLTECCRRAVVDLPRPDAVTDDPDAVTCPRRATP